MLTSHRETSGSSTHWDMYYQYAGSGTSGGGQLVLAAHPSAVTGYDDSYADLVHYTSGNAAYLADSAGLVETYAYYSSTAATDTSAGGPTCSSRPPIMTAMRSDIVSASAWSWVT